MTKSTVTPEQQAERASAWKARFEAIQQWIEAARRADIADGVWADAVADAERTVRNNQLYLDGVIYLPDGTTR